MIPSLAASASGSMASAADICANHDELNLNVDESNGIVCSQKRDKALVPGILLKINSYLSPQDSAMLKGVCKEWNITVPRKLVLAVKNWHRHGTPSWTVLDTRCRSSVYRRKGQSRKGGARVHLPQMQMEGPGLGQQIFTIFCQVVSSRR